MLKKLLALTISAAICLSFAGCSEDGSSSDGSSQPGESSVSDSSSLPEESSSAPDSSSQPEESSSIPDSSSKPEDSSDPEVVPPPAETSDITPAMWKVESNGGTVYFLGSMHALDESCYPLPDEITNAYEASDSLAVECDIITYGKDMQAQIDLASKMVYSDGTTIADHIDPELYESAKQLLTDAKLYNALYDYYNELMWAQLVEMAMMEEAGLDSTLGLDSVLLTKALEEGKDIIEIESVDFQMGILYGQPEELNKFMLECDVYYYEDQCEALTELFKAWCAGDVEAIAASEEDEDTEDGEEIEISEELQAMIDEYNKQLMDDRNAGMITKAIEMLENGDNVLYVVGAAHFVGDTGIIKGLEDAGYTVERIEYK